MFLFEWFGYMLSAFGRLTDNMGYALILAAIVFKLFLSLLTKKYYNSIVLTEIIRPQYDKIRDKHKNDPDLRNQQTMKFLMESDYPMMSRFGIILFQIIIVAGICGALSNPAQYIFNNGANLNMTFLGIPDISLSPIQIYKAYGLHDSMFISIILLMASVVLTFVHDMFMERRQLISQVGIDIFMLVAVTACSVLLSQGFMIYWIVMKIFDIFTIFIMDKFYCVNIEEKRKAWEKQPKKKINMKQETKKK